MSAGGWGVHQVLTEGYLLGGGTLFFFFFFSLGS